MTKNEKPLLKDFYVFSFLSVVHIFWPNHDFAPSEPEIENFRSRIFEKNTDIFHIWFFYYINYFFPGTYRHQFFEIYHAKGFSEGYFLKNKLFWKKLKTRAFFTFGIFQKWWKHQNCLERSPRKSFLGFYYTKISRISWLS